jgi:fatty-acyl-CoA synthase
VAGSIAAGPLEPPLIEQTIGQRLEETAGRLAQEEALVVTHQDVRLSWAELDAKVDEVAKGLMAMGIEAGDRVGMWSPNYAEWVYIQFATAKIGAIQVNVNPAYRTSELEYALRQSGCRLLVTMTSYLTSKYREMVEEVAPRLDALERVVCFDTSDWSDLVEGGQGISDEDLRERAAGLLPNDPINIQYTSGTTGFPKGATLSHANILNNAAFVGHACRHTSADRVCIPVPFYHCFGMVMGNLACCVHGSTMVVPCPTFDPEAVLRAVENERCTSLYGVPTMFIAELGHPELDGFDLSSLRTGIMAGSPCPIETMKRVIDEMNMREVTIAYGMTETSPVSTQTGADDPLDLRVSTVGQVQPHLEIKIVDPETGQVVERGVGGEFCTRGYSVMLGYWEEPEKTAQAIDAYGWMHTGDLATMDEHGYVNIIGRIKDMVIRGGENLYPREIEEFLRGAPGVVDVQVIGVPDEKFGEELNAWIQLEPGASTTEAELRAYCDGKIARHKIPRYFTFVSEFPMTVTGKVRKVEMREQAIVDLGLESAAKIQNA